MHAKLHLLANCHCELHLEYSITSVNKVPLAFYVFKRTKCLLPEKLVQSISIR